jgi:hypothetical protein
MAPPSAGFGSSGISALAALAATAHNSSPKAGGSVGGNPSSSNQANNNSSSKARHVSSGLPQQQQQQQPSQQKRPRSPPGAQASDRRPAGNTAPTHQSASSQQSSTSAYASGTGHGHAHSGQAGDNAGSGDDDKDEDAKKSQVHSSVTLLHLMLPRPNGEPGPLAAGTELVIVAQQKTPSNLTNAPLTYLGEAKITSMGSLRDNTTGKIYETPTEWYRSVTGAQNRSGWKLVRLKTNPSVNLRNLKEAYVASNSRC